MFIMLSLHLAWTITLPRAPREIFSPQTWRTLFSGRGLCELGILIKAASAAYPQGPEPQSQAPSHLSPWANLAVQDAQVSNRA